MKRIAIAVSVGLNVLFVVALIGIYAGAASGYIISAFIQPAHERWVSQFGELPVAPGDTVFLGDSITEGGSWHELFPDLAVRNRGIGGDVTAGVLARLDQVTRGKPARVFLLIGTNDIAFGVSEDDIVANVMQIVARIETESPDTQVYVQSVLPRAVDYRASVEALNARLRDGLQDRAKWIDLYPAFIDAQDGSIDDAYSNDELHLNGAGYALWRTQLTPYLN